MSALLRETALLAMIRDHAQRLERFLRHDFGVFDVTEIRAIATEMRIELALAKAKP